MFLHRSMTTRCTRGWRKRQHFRLYYAHAEYHLLFKFSKKKRKLKNTQEPWLKQSPVWLYIYHIIIYTELFKMNHYPMLCTRLLNSSVDLRPCDYLFFKNIFNTYRHRYVLSITKELSRVCNYNTQMYAHRMNIWVPTKCLVNRCLPFYKFEISLFHLMYHYTLHHCSKT